MKRIKRPYATLEYATVGPDGVGPIVRKVMPLIKRARAEMEAIRRERAKARRKSA